MNKNIKQLFFLIKDNKVILVNSNSKVFISELPKEMEGIRSYDYYFRQFKKSHYFNFEFNKAYILQKLNFN